MANAKIIGSLCGKYGWNVLSAIQDVFWTLPENLPEEAAYQALESALQLGRADITFLVEHLSSAAPQILQRIPLRSRVYFLCPPTEVCILGCRYQRGGNKGDPFRLVGHKNAIEVASI